MPAVAIATAYVSKQGVRVVAIFIILNSRKNNVGVPVSSLLSLPFYVVPECMCMLSIKKMANVHAEMRSLLFAYIECP